MIERGKADKWAARSGRLSAALRENLKRRKAQARGRAATPAAADATAGADMEPGDAEIDVAAPDFRRNPGWKSDDGSDRAATGRGRRRG